MTPRSQQADAGAKVRIKLEKTEFLDKKLKIITHFLAELKLIFYLCHKMAKMGCTRHSSSKLGSALAGTIFAIRKNIGGKFSVNRRLLGSKRALYLVNTSEEFRFLYRG